MSLRQHAVAPHAFDRPAADAQQSPPAGPSAHVHDADVRDGGALGTERRNTFGFDSVLAATVIALVTFGVVMVYSASAIWAQKNFGDSRFYLIRQGLFAGAGLTLMLAAAQVPLSWYRRLAWPAVIGSALLLLAVILGFGRSAGGAARWISLGPVNVQPAEATKLALVLWLATSLSQKRLKIRTFSVGFLPHMLVTGLLMLLCLKQPDFGSAVILGLLAFVLLLVAGGRPAYLLGGAAALVPIAWALVAFSPYRMRRIEAFLEPFEHRYGTGYQIAESLMSFGAGGVTGVGLGDSKQKLLFLPEAHTDFISAIIGEELGLIGIILLIGAYLVILWRGLRVAYFAPSEFALLLAAGATFLLTAQGMTNLAVAMGVLPTKGLVLPFVSYGGSALLVDCVAVGIILAVSRAHTRSGALQAHRTASAPRATARIEQSALSTSLAPLRGSARS